MDEHFDKDSYKTIPYQNIPGASDLIKSKALQLENLTISENDKL